MKVLVLGGTGYIGTAVVRRLRERGHQPVLLRRTAGEGLQGSEVRRGDLTDPETLRAAVTPEIDAVVHAAAPTGRWAADLAAVDAVLEPLRGTGRGLVYLSGVWVLGAVEEAVDESAAPRPIDIVAGRPVVEDRVRAAAQHGVRGIVVRPGIVHGHGGGIPQMLVEWARECGVGRYVGDDTVRWPMVHVDDLADLVVLAVEGAQAGALVHAVAEPGVRVADLAAAADVAAGGAGSAVAWSERDAAERLGAPFAEALALSQVVGTTAGAALGWSPSWPGAVEDLRGGAAPPGLGVGELRISLTVSDFERLREFYGDTLGLVEEKAWDVHGRGVILRAGRATLELLDEEHSTHVDEIEVGGRVSGRIRLAVGVRDAAAAADAVMHAGGALIGGPAPTPWGDVNARVAPPEGPQLTLFSPEGRSA